MRNWLVGAAAAAALIFAFGVHSAWPQSGLQVTYGNKGIQTLRFNGVLLEDVGAWPSDTFHIWHMKSTDLNGSTDTAGQYGWGENNLGESWNGSAHTETYTFSWGSISTQYVQNGNNLDLVVTETNNASSPVTFDGAEVYPVTLHFPQDPAGFSGQTQYAITTTGPGVSVADFGSGVVTSVIPNEAQHLYGGWKSQGAAAYNPLMSGTYPDGIAAFLPHNDLPLAPGASLTYTVSLRFTQEGTAADASDAYSSFAATYPSQMTWSDHRILGTAYLASSQPEADASQPDGYPTNPRRWFNDPNINITNALGLQQFQDRMLVQAATNIATARAMNSQGVITWDVEGEQYGMNTSYVCSPDQIAAAAPEMESVITDPASPWHGQKLDDSYFAIQRNAGLRIGVCIRPQQFVLASNGTATQNFLSGKAAIISNLENKAKFANTRWGATVFYVDSTVDSNGGTLDPAIFQKLITDMPNYLFIPEEGTPRYFAYTAPFASFLFHTDLGTPASIRNSYPNAFSANLVNDVAASTLATYTAQLTAQVQAGDILMGHADYLQANDPVLVAIYAAAEASGSLPTQQGPALNWNTPAAVPYGTPLGSSQLDATSNIPGVFTYSPSPGTIPTAGALTLNATFTPVDTTHYKSGAVSTTLQVTQLTSQLSWPTPASITAGTSLSTAQLNATSSEPGMFTYTPSAGTVLPAGNSTLTAQFTPNDSTNYASGSIFTTLTVSAPVAPTAPAPPSAPTTPNARLGILTPGSGATVSGSIVVIGHVGLTLDSAGTFLMVDGQEVGTHRVTGGPWLYALDTTTLSNGAHTLQLWGHDIGNNTTISAPVLINVSN